MSLFYLKYWLLIILTVVGNPIYQMISYVICWENKIGVYTSTNVFQANTFVFLLILVGIFCIRLVVYKLVFTSKKLPLVTKGTGSFLYIFAERHVFHIIGIVSLLIWLSPLEGNIIGFIIFPLSLLLGALVSIITFVRLLKLKKIITEKAAIAAQPTT